MVYRTFKINVLMAFISILVSVFIIEVLLRLFMPIYFSAPLEGYQYDKEIGYIARKGVHFFKLSDYQQEFQTNKLGTFNFQEEFRDYEKVVFAIGDSYTQGTGLYADASYPSQLDLMLNIDQNGEYKKNYAVINLGIAASGGEQNLLILKRYAKMIRPDIILYLGSDNDYRDDLLFRAGIRHKNIVYNNPHYGYFYYPLKFILYDTEIGKHLTMFVREKLLKPRYSVRNSADKHESLSTAELEKDVLERIINEAKNNKSVIILSWAEGQSASYSWLQNYCKDKHLLFADYYHTLSSVHQAIPRLPFNNPHSGGHYRTWVNSIIARAFANKIISQNNN